MIVCTCKGRGHEELTPYLENFLHFVFLSEKLDAYSYFMEQIFKRKFGKSAIDYQNLALRVAVFNKGQRDSHNLGNLTETVNISRKKCISNMFYI